MKILAKRDNESTLTARKWHTEVEQIALLLTQVQQLQNQQWAVLFICKCYLNSRGGGGFPWFSFTHITIHKSIQSNIFHVIVETMFKWPLILQHLFKNISLHFIWRFNGYPKDDKAMIPLGPVVYCSCQNRLAFPRDPLSPM